jgi:hypothetical protein
MQLVEHLAFVLRFELSIGLLEFFDEPASSSGVGTPEMFWNRMLSSFKRGRAECLPADIFPGLRRFGPADLLLRDLFWHNYYKLSLSGTPHSTKTVILDRLTDLFHPSLAASDRSVPLAVTCRSLHFQNLAQ